MPNSTPTAGSAQTTYHVAIIVDRTGNIRLFPQCQQRINMASPRFPTAGRIFAIGHRGVRSRSVENSLAGFRLAAALGREGRCDGVELDLRTTADGEFVVHHDPVLRSGEMISAVPLSVVRASPLEDGSPVPTLAEALEALDGLEIFIEVKRLPAERRWFARGPTSSPRRPCLSCPRVRPPGHRPASPPRCRPAHGRPVVLLPDRSNWSGP